jgi:nucleoid DNA-binding protein
MARSKGNVKTNAPIKNKVVGATAVTPIRESAAVSERFRKTEIVNELAINTGLNRRQISAVLDELLLLVHRHVKKTAVGEFILAGLIKIITVKKPATKARTGINPFTGKETTFKAKPAVTAVKVYALKGLKDMAN